ncbi:MAG: hypothetical protein SGBAC_007650, partial [Bacillariaceae sp.]
MVKNMQTIPTSKSVSSTTPTSTDIKRSRHSLDSLEKLESNHLQVIEGTIQDIQKSNSNDSTRSGKRRAKRSLKSPTEWSMNSSIPENGEDLSDLRNELDRAESVYSRRTADATFGDDFSSDEEDVVIAGNFLPIPSFEEYQKEEDPADPLTNHVHSPQRIHTSTPSVPNMPRVTTPPSQSQTGGLHYNNHNSSSLLSFPHTMETVSEDKIIGAVHKPEAKITPSKTKQTEEESTQETSSPDYSNGAVPHEVFVVKGSSASTSRTVVSTTTFQSDVPPPSTPSQRYHLKAPMTPVNHHSRDWATVAEPQRNSFTAPQPVRRHSSFSLMAAKSPTPSFFKSAQSPVHELVKKQERKRLNLKATIDSVRSNNFSVDSRIHQMQNEKYQLKREHDTEKLAHKQLVTSMDNKIKFLKRQHELQTEQQEGVLGLTQTHNKFLKEKLDQLQQEYERLLHNQKQERVRQAEEPDHLYDQIKTLENGKKRLLEKHRQELTSKQMEYESLESRLKNLQEQHVRHEKSLQERLEDEQLKIKKLQDRLVHVETVELTIAQQKILVVQDQLENARQERQDLVSQHRAASIREDDKYATLVHQHATTAQANHEEISSLNNQVSDLQTKIQKIESLRAKEQEHCRSLEQQLSDSMHHEQESTTQKSSLQTNYKKLQIALQTVQQERDSLIVSQKEQAQVQEEMKSSFLQKVARLEEECTHLQTTLEKGIASQSDEILKLRGKLDLAETEWHAQQATNHELEAKVENLETERKELIATHTAELDKAVNANVALAQNLLKDLAFG